MTTAATTSPITRSRPLRVAVLVKQVPEIEDMRLDDAGRLIRDGLELELNPYCRRAVSAGVTFAAETSGRCTVFTLGPPHAEDVIREAVAWGADDGVLVTDPAFAGSDTIATARVLATVLDKEGPFDLILTGRNSVDADTGQVGPQLAELMGLPFIGAARILKHDDGRVDARVETDDGWSLLETSLPAVVSCAERLCQPCKVDPVGRAAVDGKQIRRLGAVDLGPGPWGASASRTMVGTIKTHKQHRRPVILTGPAADQADKAVQLLADSISLTDSQSSLNAAVAVSAAHPRDDGIIVVVEPGRPLLARELLGAAADLANASQRRVTAVVPGSDADLTTLAGWGADHVVLIETATAAADVAAIISADCSENLPWAVLVPSTMWGREVASRLAVRLDAGLTGDASALEIEDDRLVAWKPAFGGRCSAAITATSAVQMVTVRPGVLPLRQPRRADPPTVSTLTGPRIDLVHQREFTREDDTEVWSSTRIVVGVGAGVSNELYEDIEKFAGSVGAVTVATRKVTDQGWMPRSRQVGITGRSVAPELYVAIGISGSSNHLVGVQAAKTIVAVNNDPAAAIFTGCDIGIVADWIAVLPHLTKHLVSLRGLVSTPD
jgi:electron transfer flavoprotein alpha subunit